MKARRPKVLSPARLLVAPWLERLGMTPRSFSVFEAWDQLLGPEASKARASGLKGSVLHVDVDHSARLHDLTLRRPQLLKRLQGYFGEKGPKGPPVSDIIFRISDGNR